MANVGSLEIDLLLESSSFMNGMKRAHEQTAESAEKIKESLDMAKEAVIGLAEAMAVDFLVEKINSALEYAESIKKVEEATGIATDKIQEFAYQASQVGIGFETSQAGLETFTVALGKADSGNQKFLKRLAQLGVTSRDPYTALLQLADGVKKFDTSTADAASDAKRFLGSASFAPILKEGAEGFSEAAKQAKEYGLVMGGDVIENSVEAEHKLTALKMVITADWATMIDRNATAISSLADSLLKVTSAVGSFLGSHPEMAGAALGALGGSRIGGMFGGYGALIGAGAGGVAGYVGGSAMHTSMDNSNTDPHFRAQKLIEAKERLSAAMASPNNSANSGWKTGSVGPNTLVADAKAAFDEELARYRSAKAHANDKPEGNGNKGLLPPPKGPKEKKPPRDKSADQQATFDKELGAETLQTYGLKAQLETSDPRLAANYQRDTIRYDYGSVNPDTGLNNRDGQKDKEVDDQLNAGKFGDKNSALAKSRAEELKKQNDINGELKISLVNRKLDTELDAEALAAKTADITNQEEILKASLDVARTAEERKGLNAKIIDLQYQQEAAQLQNVLASKASTNAEKEIAEKRLALLPILEAQAQEKSAQQNEGPIAAYLRAMPKTVADIGESLQTAAVSGLGSLTDGIAAAINGTGTLKSAFSGLAMSIISDLEKIVIEETIVKPLANLLTGGSGGGGGLLGSIAKSLGGALLGGGGGAGVDSVFQNDLPGAAVNTNLGDLSGFRANGGMTSPGDYMVGERGPEIVSIGAPSNVTPTRALNSLGGGGGGSTTINSTVSGVNDPAMVRQLAAQTIMQALPVQLKLSSDNTQKRLNYPRMR